jgi:hypothetical protein
MVRTIEADRVFSSDALQLVDELAQRGVNLNTIRFALHKATGVWYRDSEIIAAGKVFGHLLERQQAGAPTVVAVPVPEAKERPVQKTGLVRPGTFSVPPGGYRIGRAT